MLARVAVEVACVVTSTVHNVMHRRPVYGFEEILQSEKLAPTLGLGLGDPEK